MHIRLLALAVITGCTSRPPVAVEVDRGVPANQFAMSITEPRALAAEHPIELIALELSPGDGEHVGSAGTPIWVAAHIKGQPYLRPPVRLRMGDSVPGYAASATPALVLGRYEARVSAGGVIARTRFRVNERGRIE